MVQRSAREDGRSHFQPRDVRRVPMTTASSAVRSAALGLGARVRPGGTDFALRAPQASRVELVLVDEVGGQVAVDLRRDAAGIWHGHVPGVAAGQRYGYRVHGDWDPRRGLRFNPAKLLLDPYARAITGGVDYAGPVLSHPVVAADRPDPRDSSAAVPLSVVVADSPPPTPMVAPVPLATTVLYELHVKGFSQLHAAVPTELQGTYAGLADPAVIAHLVALGVTAVELLPVHHFVSEPFLVERGLSNYWGYNTLGFFAPHAAYASRGSLGGQVEEFKDMVSAFHAAGLEVILDVVYNHTGEAGESGPTLSLRGIDDAGFYRLTEHGTPYDLTGCGNSVNTAARHALDLVLDSLRYWVTEMGVDGFRFDLVSTLIRDQEHQIDLEHIFLSALREDPVLARVKLIAEPWDLGPHGYQLGSFGHGWSEWNDKFRGHVRDFWRGEVSGVAELAARLAGSPDIFDPTGRPVTATVNFITAHDGFTLRDLVSYDRKHNAANGEGNRDGSDDNRSWNCGHEGETDDPSIIALRHRQARNLMATLLLAAGVPMLTAGDELGRTPQGNNNAYCQDSLVSWLDWASAADWQDLTDLTAKLLALRAEHPIFRRTTYRHGEPVVDSTGHLTGRKNLAWFGGGETEMTREDWADGARRTLGMYLAHDDGSRDCDDTLLIWFHGGPDPVEVTLPGRPWADTYTVAATTTLDGELSEEKILAGGTLRLPGRSVVVLSAD